MRIVALLILITITQTFALDSYAQNKRLSLNFKNEKIINILDAIEKQSEFYFMFDASKIDVTRRKSIDCENRTITSILDQLFEDTGITYRISDRQIGLISTEFADAEQGEMTVSGKVTDSSGAPLPGVTVVVKGTTKGIITDADGNYSLSSIPVDATLIFSFVGMKTQEISVSGKATINIVMAEDAIGIEEVVAIGYGTMKKSDLTSAIAKVEGDDLKSRPVARLDQALQGQMAGVHVQQSGSRPGKNANIRVRGIGSITAGVDPLYVVDGFPVDEETFANLNLNNIESVEVLKDAASASIYGSRGSNGVVIVTTKRGLKGQELKLDLNAYTGLSTIEKRIPFLNSAEQILYMKDALDDAWIRSGGDESILPDDRPYNYAYNKSWADNPESLPNYDQLGAILQTGQTQSFQVTVSGASEKSRYLVSGEYYDQTGIVKNTDYNRYSFRTNLDVDITKFLTIGLNLSPSFIISEDKDTEGKGATIHKALWSSPFLPSRQGYWGESDAFSAFFVNHEIPMALATIEHLKDKTERSQVLANVYGQIKIIPGLNFKTTFNANYYSSRRDRFENQIIARTGTPAGYSWNTQVLDWLNENLLTYEKTIEKHRMNAVLGFTSQKNEYKYSYMSGTGYANDYVPTLNAASSWNASTTMSEWSLLSYLGRVNYSFADKYLLGASIRSDGSSRFGSSTKWGWFPSFSGGWKIDQEDFIKSLDFVNRLKLRVSWGKTGNNNIGDYSAIGLMGTNSYAFGESETIVNGASPSTISNSNLSWEKTATLDAGLDIGVFNNRLSFAIDYYNKQTSDLLLNVPVPTFTGFVSEIRNYGKVENKGWEFELNTVNIDRALKWRSNINLSFNKNNVKQLGSSNAPIISGDWWGQNNITAVGHPIGSFYMYKQLGVYNTQEEIDATPHVAGSRPGDAIIEDYNKDGKIDTNDREIFGSNIPKYFFGITNQLNFKGFDLSVLVNGVGGNQIWNAMSIGTDSPRNSHLPHYKKWVNRWRSAEEPGDGMTPRASNSPTGGSNYWLSRFLYDGSYVRLKNVTLGYTLSSKVVQKLNLSSVRVYLQGENLHTWDHYDAGFTPEVDLSNGVPTTGGRDYGMYPSARTFIFGVNVSF